MATGSGGPQGSKLVTHDSTEDFEDVLKRWVKSDWEWRLAQHEARKAELQQQLTRSPSNREEPEKELKKTDRKIEGAVSRIKYCEGMLQKLIDGSKEDHRKQEFKRQFDNAMKDGYVSLQTNTVLLMGVAGGGKSSLKDAMVDRPPRKERHSTIVRDKILHVRPVSNVLLQSTDNKWVEVSEQDMINLLATAVKHLPRSSLDTLPSNLKAKLQEVSTSTTSSESVLTNTPGHDPSYRSPVQQAISSVIELVLSAMDSSKQTGSDQPIEGMKVFGTKTSRMVDNGGQPQFQDVASLFLRHASAALFVSRLTDDFNDYPLDEFYKDGELVGPPCASHMSHGETIMSLLRSFLSHGTQEKKRLAIFVCTFLDKAQDPKVLEEKNKALLELLPPELKEEVVYSNPGLNRVIFALNALGRDDDTKAVVQEIRKAVESAPSSEIEVPLWWFILELALQKLCSILGRGVLRKSECIELARCLGFHSDSLDGALYYFNDLCIAHHYPEILPDTVFVDPQVPLDKVSELTQHAISLRKATEASAVPSKKWRLFGKSKKADKAPAVAATSAKWKRFRDEGILTLEMLSSPKFQKHFEEGLFEPADMIKIMIELLIIAPLTIPLLGKIDCPLTEMEFLMPTLLRSVPSSELEGHRVFSASADPLLIRFLSGCIRCGVFCCLIVFLTKRYGWQVCLPSGEPVLLARNCVKLRIPDGPGVVTLIDSFTHIEVHISARPRVCHKVCPQIRSILLEGVNAAATALHYNNDKPVTSIFCPHTDSAQEKVKPKRHYAEVYPDTGLWCCSKNACLDGDLSLGHLVWFSENDSLLDDIDASVPPSKKITPEYKALTEWYPTLVLCIQQAPNSVADQLKACRMLSPEDECYLINPSHDNDQKARRILNAVLLHVQLNPRVYQTFIEALKRAGDWTRAVVTELETSLSVHNTRPLH